MLNDYFKVEHGKIIIKDKYKFYFEEWAEYANNMINTRTVFTIRDYKYLQDIYIKRIIELTFLIRKY